MKKIFALLSILSVGLWSCSEDEKIIDPVFEFVSIKGNESINLNEATNSEVAYPIVAQLWAAKPYSSDIDIELEITGTNASSGTDFMIPSEPLKIRAGKFLSDTLWVNTVNNSTASELDRTVEVKLKSTNFVDIKLGLGIDNPIHQAIVFKIIDDECSAKITVFGSNLNNAVNWGGGDILFPATGILVGNELTVSGNLIDYGPLSNGEITITLTPESLGATKGSATFGTQFAGTDSDGYDYQFTQTGNGTYDVCSGTVSIAYDIYYESGGWVYWYSVSNVYSLIQCTETVDVFDTSLTNTLDWGDGPIVKPASGIVAGNVLTVSGDLIDYGPFSGATLSITLNPYSAGGTKGTATFGEQETGTDDDGYLYKFVQTGDGSYDVCSGKVNVVYDIYYDSGGWVYWYSVTNEFTLP